MVQTQMEKMLDIQNYVSNVAKSTITHLETLMQSALRTENSLLNKDDKMEMYAAYTEIRNAIEKYNQVIRDKTLCTTIL